MSEVASESVSQVKQMKQVSQVSQVMSPSHNLHFTRRVVLSVYIGGWGTIQPEIVSFRSCVRAGEAKLRVRARDMMSPLLKRNQDKCCSSVPRALRHSTPPSFRPSGSSTPPSLWPSVHVTNDPCTKTRKTQKHQKVSHAPARPLPPPSPIVRRNSLRESRSLKGDT